jgi:hypothetical protein
MPKKDLELDLTPLMKIASKASNKILLKEALASNQFAQIGLNMFRDQTTNCFWKLEHGDDGQDYIVRGGPETNIVVESENNDWAATSDSNKENITLSYRKMPICKFAAVDFGLTNDSIEDFQKYLLERVKEAAFVRSLYAYTTGRCPGCGSKPLHIGLNEVTCSTPGCTNS